MMLWNFLENDTKNILEIDIEPWQSVPPHCIDDKHMLGCVRIAGYSMRVVAEIGLWITEVLEFLGGERNNWRTFLNPCIQIRITFKLISRYSNFYFIKSKEDMLSFEILE